jgi:5-formyltetrahydrofolate cyclo-ligase
MTKAELRKLYKQKRLELSPGELSRVSEIICDEALSSFQLEDKTISLFLPIERQGEINTYNLLERAHAIGATIGLPVSDFHNNELKHIKYSEKTVLKVNQFGIPEPESGDTIAPSKFDFVFVPLLVADESGHRVGYGKGFYDRFLEKCSPTCKFIGLSIFDPIEEISDIDEYDVQLDVLISGGL